jgi:hypothetical protein
MKMMNSKDNNNNNNNSNNSSKTRDERGQALDFISFFSLNKVGLSLHAVGEIKREKEDFQAGCRGIPCLYVPWHGIDPPPPPNLHNNNNREG